MTRIAIVEDDAAISQMYRIKFENEGFKVDTADNGFLGLQLVDSMQPDILLLDLMMPEMNGDEMLKKLRKTPFGKSLKVVILTNMGESEAPDVVKELGVSAFIVKANMTPRQVVDLIKKQLEA